MSDVHGLISTQTAAAYSKAKSPAAPAEQGQGGGLIEFLSLLFGQIMGTQAQPEQEMAEGRKLPGDEAATDPSKFLSAAGDLPPSLKEKIAASDDLSDADKKALLELIAKLKANMNSGDGPAIEPSLTADLAHPASALQAQDAADTDLGALAEMLNDIEPGADAADVLSPEAMAFFKKLLADEGVPLEKIKTYLAAIDPKTGEISRHLSAAAPDATAPKDVVAETDEGLLRYTQQSEEATKTARAEKAAARAEAQAQNAPAQPQNAAPAPKTAAHTSVMALSQGFGGGDAGLGADNFSSQPDFQRPLHDMGGNLKTADAASGSNFINFTSAAGRSMPASTTQMIALQVQRNASAKVDTFTMQLDPAELGRLDIKMKFERDGMVKVHLSADRPETLSMLQKDSAQLEKLLQQAGLDTDSGTLSFDLRDGGERFSNDDRQQGDDGIRAARADDDTVTLQAEIAAEVQGHVGRTGINIMA